MSKDEIAGPIAYSLTKVRVIDMPTARSFVDDALPIFFEIAAQIVEAYDRKPFPGFEAGVELIKKDLAYRLRKAGKS